MLDDYLKYVIAKKIPLLASCRQTHRHVDTHIHVKSYYLFSPKPSPPFVSCERELFGQTPVHVFMLALRAAYAELMRANIFFRSDIYAVVK